MNPVYIILGVVAAAWLYSALKKQSAGAMTNGANGDAGEVRRFDPFEIPIGGSPKLGEGCPPGTRPVSVVAHNLVTGNIEHQIACIPITGGGIPVHTMAQTEATIDLTAKGGKLFLGFLLALLLWPASAQAQNTRTYQLAQNVTVLGGTPFVSSEIDNRNFRGVFHTLLLTKNNTGAGTSCAFQAQGRNLPDAGWTTISTLSCGTTDNRSYVSVAADAPFDFIRGQVDYSAGGGQIYLTLISTSTLGSQWQLNRTFFGFSGADNAPNSVLGWPSTSLGGESQQVPLGTAGYAFDGVAWDRLRTVQAGQSNSPFGLQVVPYLSDGLGSSNADVLESAFLVQQQGTAAEDSNDGSGVLPLLGLDTGLDTFNMLRSSIQSGLVAGRPFEYQSFTNSFAYNVNRTATNPATGDYLNVTAGATNPIFYEQLIVSTMTAAAKFDILLVNTPGTTCTVLTEANEHIPNTSAGAVSNHTCTTDPVTVATYARISMAGNTTEIFDLRGLWASGGSGDGISIGLVTSPGAGNDLSVTIRFRENTR